MWQEAAIPAWSEQQWKSKHVGLNISAHNHTLYPKKEHFRVPPGCHERASLAKVSPYLMFILWVLKPRRGSRTKLVARSSVSHSSFTLILLHPSIASHPQHAAITGSMLRYNNKPPLRISSASVCHLHKLAFSSFSAVQSRIFISPPFPCSQWIIHVILAMQKRISLASTATRRRAWACRE